ncbi:hypothetical protein C790_02358 [Morganella morganii SC01]|nr:hypothetical protein C790_02358 [Morganella morganii SC01]
MPSQQRAAKTGKISPVTSDCTGLFHFSSRNPFFYIQVVIGLSLPYPVKNNALLL